MEHCYLAKEYKLLTTDRVPYVATDDHLKVSFLEFPRCHPELNDPHLLESNAHATAVFQTWYFFLFLQELLGPFYDHSEYIVSQPDGNGGEIAFITTVKLNARLKQWVDHVKQRRGEYHGLEDHLWSCFELMSQNWLSKAPHVSPRVHQSAISCIESAAAAIGDALDAWDLPTVRYIRVARPIDIASMSAYGGWCPQLASKALESVQYTQSVLLLRSLQVASTTHDHGSCSQNRCLYVTSNLTQVRDPDHVNPGCACGMKGISSEDLSSILSLNEDSFPILQAEISFLGKIKFSLVNYYPGMQFFAISHVWSDGLGNAKANTLPLCRVEMVVKLIRSFVKKSLTKQSHRKVNIWLDTLCCPVGPVSAKLKALVRIKDVYQKAAHVIVLDSAIMSHSFNNDTLLDAALLALSSRWMFRLWTLQEALLADRLWFCFSNAMIEVNWLVVKIAKALFGAPYNQTGIYRDIFNRIDQIRRYVYRSSFLIPGYDLQALNSALEHRAVTVSSDEPLCLANMMGFDIAIEKITPDMRMPRFWKELADHDGIRSNIIFNHYPRLQVQGYGWAPATILRDGSSKVFHRYPYIGDCTQGLPARSSPSGLIVHYGGYLLRTNLSYRSPYLHSRYDCRTLFGVAKSQKSAFVHVRDTTENDRWYAVHLDPWVNKETERFAADTRCALISRYGLHTNSLDALFVKILQEDEHAMFVRTIGVCGIWPHTEHESRLLTRMANHDSFDEISNIMRKDASENKGLLVDLVNEGTAEELEHLIMVFNEKIREGVYFTVSRHMPVGQRWVVD